MAGCWIWWNMEWKDEGALAAVALITSSSCLWHDQIHLGSNAVLLSFRQKDNIYRGFYLVFFFLCKPGLERVWVILIFKNSFTHTSKWIKEHPRCLWAVWYYWSQCVRHPHINTVEHLLQSSLHPAALLSPTFMKTCASLFYPPFPVSTRRPVDYVNSVGFNRCGTICFLRPRNASSW